MGFNKKRSLSHMSSRLLSRGGREPELEEKYLIFREQTSAFPHVRGEA